MTDNKQTDNKQVVLDWFAAFSSGDADRANALTHEDFRFFMPGTMRCSGWRDRSGFSDLNRMLGSQLAGGAQMRIGEPVAERDRVFVEAETEAMLKNGKAYQNDYIMAFRIRDGKVVEMKEFSDVLHVHAVMDSEETRLSEKPRDRHLADPWRTYRT